MPVCVFIPTSKAPTSSPDQHHQVSQQLQTQPHRSVDTKRGTTITPICHVTLAAPLNVFIALLSPATELTLNRRYSRLGVAASCWSPVVKGMNHLQSTEPGNNSALNGLPWATRGDLSSRFPLGISGRDVCCKACSLGTWGSRHLAARWV